MKLYEQEVDEEHYQSEGADHPPCVNEIHDTHCNVTQNENHVAQDQDLKFLDALKREAPTPASVIQKVM